MPSRRGRGDGIRPRGRGFSGTGLRPSAAVSPRRLGSAGVRDRDWPRQARTARLLLRRHRRRALAAHARPEEVSVSWLIDAYHFDIPVMAAPMDSVVSPESAIVLGKLGALPSSTSRGCGPAMRTRPRSFGRSPRSTPTPRRPACSRSTPSRSSRAHHRAMRQLREAGVTVAGALSPQRTQQHWKTVVDAGVDLFVIRGTTVSAEHVFGPRRAAQPQEVHLRARRARYRRRRRLVHRGAAPHAHRCGRRLSSASAAAPPTRRGPRSASTPDGIGRRRRRGCAP